MRNIKELGQTNKMPLNESFVIRDDSQIRVLIKQISETSLITSYYDPADDRQVLRVTAAIPSGNASLDMIDYKFWEVTLDGIKMQEGSPVHGKATVNPDTKKIQFSSR